MEVKRYQVALVLNGFYRFSKSDVSQLIESDILISTNKKKAVAVIEYLEKVIKIAMWLYNLFNK